MHFEFTVTLDVERVTGKFASRDDIAERIQDDLESAAGDVDLDGLGADGESEYEVTDSEVTPA